MMTCPECTNDIHRFPCSCGYAPAQSSSAPLMARETYIQRSKGLTKEEFGLMLSDVIQTISGIRSVEELIRLAIHKHEGCKLQRLKERRLDQKHHLAALLPQLTETDMRKILDRYPYVVEM